MCWNEPLRIDKCASLREKSGRRFACDTYTTISTTASAITSHCHRRPPPSPSTTTTTTNKSFIFYLNCKSWNGEHKFSHLLIMDSVNCVFIDRGPTICIDFTNFTRGLSWACGMIIQIERVYFLSKDNVLCLPMTAFILFIIDTSPWNPIFAKFRFGILQSHYPFLLCFF